MFFNSLVLGFMIMKIIPSQHVSTYSPKMYLTSSDALLRTWSGPAYGLQRPGYQAYHE